jgi:dihydrofolate reductase
MATGDFNITVHMVSSLDGFIAKKDNSVSWFDTQDTYEAGIAMPDPTSVLSSVDCYVMGSRTYEHAVELSAAYGWPYGDTPTVVLTRRKLPANRANIAFYSGDLHNLVTEQLKPKYHTVWFVGGAQLTKDVIRMNLADEIRINILPILLGDGLPFFDHIGLEQALHLKESKAYKNGMIELCYKINR